MSKLNRIDKLVITSVICALLSMVLSAMAYAGERYFDGCNSCYKNGNTISCTTLYCEGIVIPPEVEKMPRIYEYKEIKPEVTIIELDRIETEYLEVIGKNIHLRIYKCGKVEKLEWKEINKNEEQGRSFIIYPNSHNVPLTLYN